jgi:hypothetical protein
MGQDHIARRHSLTAHWLTGSLTETPQIDVSKHL